MYLFEYKLDVNCSDMFQPDYISFGTDLTPVSFGTDLTPRVIDMLSHIICML